MIEYYSSQLVSVAVATEVIASIARCLSCLLRQAVLEGLGLRHLVDWLGPGPPHHWTFAQLVTNPPELLPCPPQSQNCILRHLSKPIPDFDLHASKQASSLTMAIQYAFPKLIHLSRPLTKGYLTATLFSYPAKAKWCVQLLTCTA